MRPRDLFLLILAAALASAQAPSPAPPVKFRSGTRIVEITLSATTPPKRFALRDRIHPPVKNLQAADLRIFDNGVEQTIASFEKIVGAAPVRNGVSVAGEDSGARQAGVDHRPIRFAQYRGQRSVHQPRRISKLFDRLPPDTRFALLGMDEYFRVLQDFSSDRRALRAAIHKYEWDYAFSAFADGDAPYATMSPTARIARSVDALKQVARLAANVRGKKNVLWMSSGFALPPFRGEVMKAVHELVAADVALYPIDPGGILPASTDDIEELAALTGGKAFAGSNDVAGMALKALKSTSEGYVLTFVPTGYREDGSYHELRVETSRPHVELHYRIGYVADPSN